MTISAYWANWQEGRASQVTVRPEVKLLPFPILPQSSLKFPSPPLCSDTLGNKIEGLRSEKLETFLGGSISKWVGAPTLELETRVRTGALTLRGRVTFESYLMSLSLSFLFFKMVIIPTSQGCCEEKMR